MDIIDWINNELKPKPVDSTAFIYNEMESQSGYCLPIIYQEFDWEDVLHWRDRGSMLDFLFSVEGENKQLLDFGPGDGWPSLIVAPYAGKVIGADFAGKLFYGLSDDEKPKDVAALDKALRPLIRIVINMPAPIEADPMITAVKK